MTHPTDVYLASRRKAYGRLRHDLPEGVGWACYEVALPARGGATCAWLNGGRTDALNPSDDQISRMAGAFANDQRVGLMRSLEAGHTTFAALKEATGMTAGRLQHHLKELALAGFLRDTRQRNHYELSTVGRALLHLMLCIGQWPPEAATSEPILAPSQV